MRHITQRHIAEDSAANPCSYEELRAGREFVNRYFVTRLTLSYKRNVIIRGYIPESPNNMY